MNYSHIIYTTVLDLMVIPLDFILFSYFLTSKLFWLFLMPLDICMLPMMLLRTLTETAPEEGVFLTWETAGVKKESPAERLRPRTIFSEV